MDAVAEMPLKELIKTLPDYDPYYDSDGYYFDEEAAERAIFWIESCCTFTKGEWAKRPMILEPWQKASVANSFGWLSITDGTRRYREVFIYVPRKNGKTEIAGAIILYVFFCDGEYAAECYSAAAEGDQAKIVWDVSKRMIENKPEIFEQYCKVYTKSISHFSTDSFFKYITAGASTKHGFGTHACVVDEVHAQADDELVEVLETSTGARRQPLMVFLTTADYDRPSLCNRMHKRCRRVLLKEISDPQLLPILYEADREKDDWEDPETWKKANPNYGVSLKLDYFMRKFNKAKTEPSFENTFKRLHLNMKTEQASRWLQMHTWDASCEKFDRAKMIEELKGSACWAGLDLASTIDTACLCLLFDTENYGMVVIPYFWIPKDSALGRDPDNDKEKLDRVPYRVWEKQKLIEFTPGNRIDYDYIVRCIVELSEYFRFNAIGFDDWNATQTAIHLADHEGMPMVTVRQGYKSMNEPCKAIEADIAQEILNHGHNPIMRWMAANVMVQYDPADNIKMNKAKSAEKIDGMVALAMAYACFQQEEDDTSPYESHGIRTLDLPDEDE